MARAHTNQHPRRAARRVRGKVGGCVAGSGDAKAVPGVESPLPTRRRGLRGEPPDRYAGGQSGAALGTGVAAAAAEHRAGARRQSAHRRGARPGRDAPGAHAAGASSTAAAARRPRGGDTHSALGQERVLTARASQRRGPSSDVANGRGALPRASTAPVCHTGRARQGPHRVGCGGWSCRNLVVRLLSQVCPIKAESRSTSHCSMDVIRLNEWLRAGFTVDFDHIQHYWESSNASPSSCWASCSFAVVFSQRSRWSSWVAAV